MPGRNITRRLERFPADCAAGGPMRRVTDVAHPPLSFVACNEAADHVPTDNVP
jgi:hypothetical protein